MKIPLTPAPNRFAPEPSIGRDFLGQQSLIQHMANRCLPSFTNTTKKVRYYSFWAWAFLMLQNKSDKFKDEKSRWFYLMKLETALIVCNKMRNPNITGMAGIEGIPFKLERIDELKGNDLITLYSEKQRATSFAAVQYSPSLGSLNIVKKDGNYYQILHYGKQLANIFDNRIVKNNSYDKLIDPFSKSITKSCLEELIDAFNLEKISKEEKELFKEIIEQDEFNLARENKISPRVLTSLLILDIIKNRKIEYPKDILSYLWIGGYVPPQQLQDIFGGWRIVEARRFYQFAIESVLSSFCQYLKSLDNRESNFEEFLNELNRKNKEFKLGVSKVNSLTEIVRKNKSMDSFYKTLIAICTKEKISEQDIIDKIHSIGNKTGYLFNSTFAYYALILILLLFSRFPKLEQIRSNQAKEFLLRPYDLRHSFVLISKLLNSWMHLPVSDAISKIFTEFSLKLHLGVAQDKWLQTGNFTFKYIKAEPTGFKLNKNDSIMYPNRTSNKILAYIEIIKDIGLLKFHNGAYKVTSEGNAFINYYFKYL